MIVIDKPLNGPNGVPFLQLLMAVQGLRAINNGMRLTRMATPAVCMEIISNVTGVKYKRTHRNIALADGEAVLESIRQQKGKSKPKS